MNLMTGIRHHALNTTIFMTILITISVVEWPRGIHNAIHRTVVLPATRLFNVGPWQRRGQFHWKPVRAVLGGPLARSQPGLRFWPDLCAGLAVSHRLDLKSRAVDPK